MSKSRLKNKNWLIAGTIITIVFIIIGIFAIERVYKSPFPLKTQQYNLDDNLDVIDFKCHSHKKYPVMNEELKCCAIVEHISKNKSLKYFPTAIYVGEHEFGGDYYESWKPRGFKISVEKISQNKEKICSDVRINNKGRNTYTLGVIYNDSVNKKHTIFLDEITFYAYDIVEYDNKINQTLSLYFLLVSLSVFSVFSFLKNLIDIIKDR